MELKEVLFYRQFDFPKELLPEDVANKSGSRRLVFSLTSESNGYAIWKQVLTWPYAHSEDCDEELILIKYERCNQYSHNRNDQIEKTLTLFNIELEKVRRGNP